MSRAVVGLRRASTGRSLGYSQRLFSSAAFPRHPSEPCLVLPRCPASLCARLPSLLARDLRGAKDGVCAVHHLLSGISHSAAWTVLVSGIRGWTGGPPGLSGLSEPAARVGFSSLCRFRPRVSTVFGAGRPQSPLCPAAAGSAERGIGREHQEGVRGKYRLRFRTSAFYFGVVLE